MAKSKLATVVENRQTMPGSNIYFLRFSFGDLRAEDFSPGQFIIMPSLNGDAWGRPYSIAEITKDDTGIYVKVVGDPDSNSSHYSRLKIGEKINIIGPSGSSFKLLEGVDEYIFVGGGTGIAPLLPMAEKTIQAEKGTRFLIGAKNELQIFGLAALNKLGIKPQIILDEKPPDDDRCFLYPTQGQVTELLASVLAGKNHRIAVIACGPRLMLAKVAELCVATKVKCLVSVEVLMCCGTGLCCGCAIEGIDGAIKYVCQDGPLFDAAWINWAPGKFIPHPVVAIESAGVCPDGPLKTVIRKKDRRIITMEYPWVLGAGGDSLAEAENDPGRKVGGYRPKGVTLKPKSGNPVPRICESDEGMLNSIGMYNKGVDRFIEEDLPRWLVLGKPVEVQIAGETAEEYSQVAEKFKNLPLTAVCLNISCPNIENGLAFGADPIKAGEIVRSVRGILPYVSLSVKLTPNVTDIVSVARAVVKGGADSVSLINTLKGMRIDINTRRAKLGKKIGGYSGHGILPVGIAAVYQVFQAQLGVPIGGIGGITCGAEALEYFLAGATWVEIVTAYVANRHIFDEITATVSNYLAENHLGHIRELIGKVD